MHSAHSQICTWLQLASEAGVPACLFGPVGTSWQFELLKELQNMHGFAKTYHHACHFRLKIDISKPHRPSKICYVALSKPAMPMHLCECKVSQREHVSDWGQPGTTLERRPRLRLHMDLAERVAIDWMQHVALPSFHNVHHDTPDRDTYLQTLLSQHSPLPAVQYIRIIPQLKNKDRNCD